jgi:hypothetical protein
LSKKYSKKPANEKKSHTHRIIMYYYRMYSK